MKEKILVVDDERLIRQSLEKGLAAQGYTVFSAEDGKAALRLAEEESPDLVVLDLKLPDLNGIEVLKGLRELEKDMPVLVITAYGSIDTAIQAIRSGAYDYITKPFDLEALLLSVNQALDASRLKKEVTYFRSQETTRSGLHRIIGQSPAMREVGRWVRQIAQSEASTVLLEGESGTGKDLVARTILIESELFGHEKGAFTDAKTRKAGLLETANRGTLYLDEIGDMNPPLQSKLLSMIENKRFRRLGGVKDLSVDVRFIAATNRDLASAVEKGGFRKDLYYRLKVFSIHLPPLRERLSDLPQLIGFFLAELQREFKKKISGLSAESEKVLAGYHWPGNVRELRNVLERAFILCEGERIEPSHLPPELTAPITPPPKPGESLFRLPPEGVHLETLEEDLIRQALEVSSGNQVRAAKLLGISRDALRYRMKKFNWS
jgi:two-component system response regulator AtoC